MRQLIHFSLVRDMKITGAEPAVEVQQVVLLQKMVHVLRLNAVHLERALVEEGLLLQVLNAAQDWVHLYLLGVLAVIDEEVLAVEKRAIGVLDEALLDELLGQLQIQLAQNPAHLPDEVKVANVDVNQ